MLRLEVHEDDDALAGAAARAIAGAARAAVMARGRCLLVLAGGETPRRAYQRLAAGAGADASLAMPWESVEVMFGDERWVRPNDPRLNATMVDEALLSRVPVPASRVHRMPTTGATPAEDAAAYERELRAVVGEDAEGPTFDLVLLGVGADGHTASLFPGTPAVDERARWVAPVRAPAPVEPSDRLTMTWPVLARAREILVLCAGEGKRAVLAALLAGTPWAATLPAARLARLPQARWLVDRAAAGPT